MLGKSGKSKSSIGKSVKKVGFKKSPTKRKLTPEDVEKATKKVRTSGMKIIEDSIVKNTKSKIKDKELGR